MKGSGKSAAVVYPSEPVEPSGFDFPRFKWIVATSSAWSWAVMLGVFNQILGPTDNAVTFHEIGQQLGLALILLALDLILYPDRSRTALRLLKWYILAVCFGFLLFFTYGDLSLSGWFPRALLGGALLVMKMLMSMDYYGMFEEN